MRLGERLAAELAVPHVALLARVDERPPQREMANAAQQAANVRGAFRVVGATAARHRRPARRPPHSGWTLAMVGGQLRRGGAERIVPLVLATLL